MPSIYIDESGQFAKDGGNKYFVVASFTVADPKVSWKGFQSWQNLKYPKLVRRLPEVKFSEKLITNDLRLATLRTISQLKVQIRYVYLDKKNIPEKFRHKGSLRDGQLYAHIIAELLELYFPIKDMDLRVFCDERHLKGVTRKDFLDNLQAYLIPLMSPGSLVQVDMVHSHENTNVQIADWIAGALSRYLNNRPLGQKCFNVLHDNIMGSGKELFKDIWVRN